MSRRIHCFAALALVAAAPARAQYFLASYGGSIPASPPTLSGDGDGNGARELCINGWSPFYGVSTFDPVGGDIGGPYLPLSPGSQFGKSMAPLQDVTGDGIEDVLVGSPGSMSERGKLFVLDGRSHRFVDVFSFPGPNGGFGSVLADLGDVTGDGVREVLVSEPSAAITGTGALGRVHVLSPAPLSIVYSVTAAGDGDQPGPLAGGADVDADGVPDFVVGSPGAKVAGKALVGLARVYSGASGALLHEFQGTALNEQFATRVALLPNFGDHHAEVAILSPGVSGGVGAVHVYSGATYALLYDFKLPGSTAYFGLAGVGDLDADGHGDFAVASGGDSHVVDGASGAVLFTKHPFAAFAYVGDFELGDVDGDGFPEYTIELINSSGSHQFDIESFSGMPAGVKSFGSGCASGRFEPTITTCGGGPLATGNPDFRVLLGHAPPSAPAILFVGASQRQWNGTLLPIDLSPFGSTGCSLRVSAEAPHATTTTPEGKAFAALPIPPGAFASGSHLYLQWYAGGPGPLVGPGVVTAGLEITFQ